MKLSIELPKSKALYAELKAVEKETQKAVQNAIKDTASRAPAQVTKAVTAVYGIKSGDVTAAGKDAKKGSKRKINVSGLKVGSIQLTYSGRLLTPTHFSMTPKERPAGGKKYKIKAAIYKGPKKVLGSGMFLAPAKGEGTTVIPWKKTPEKRWPVEPVKTVSIPQMIDNEKVHADIKEKVDAILVERINHHTERALKKRG